MNEKDIAHLRFLYGRTTKGDILTQEDYEFVLGLEEKIQATQNTICKILMAEKHKIEHL